MPIGGRDVADAEQDKGNYDEERDATMMLSSRADFVVPPSSMAESRRTSNGDGRLTMPATVEPSGSLNSVQRAAAYWGGMLMPKLCNSETI